MSARLIVVGGLFLVLGALLATSSGCDSSQPTTDASTTGAAPGLPSSIPVGPATGDAKKADPKK